MIGLDCVVYKSKFNGFRRLPAAKQNDVTCVVANPTTIQCSTVLINQ